MLSLKKNWLNCLVQWLTKTIEETKHSAALPLILNKNVFLLLWSRQIECMFCIRFPITCWVTATCLRVLVVCQMVVVFVLLACVCVCVSVWCDVGLLMRWTEEGWSCERAKSSIEWECKTAFNLLHPSTHNKDARQMMYIIVKDWTSSPLWERCFQIEWKDLTMIDVMTFYEVCLLMGNLQTLVIARSWVPFLVFTITTRVRPSSPETAFWTSPNGHLNGGTPSSLRITMSPGSKLGVGDFHFWRCWSSCKYSLCHRRQNCCWRDWTNW